MARIWQNIEGTRHICHWWQESNQRKITAMNEIPFSDVLSTVLALVALLAGLAALILSRGVAPGSVEAVMESTANPLPCPDTSQPIYANFPGVNSGAPQTCTGGTGHNSFYGAGEIDARGAVD